MSDTGDAPPFRSLRKIGDEIGDIRSFLARSAEEEHRIPIVPCDSPIEDIFLWEFRKVANDDIQVRPQHYCKTRSGAFRLDFVLARCTGGPKIGIECDGRDFHSNETRDSKRDAAIVAAGVVDKIYRLRGRDIYFRIHDALQLLSQREPWLLSDRGQLLLEQLSEPEARREDVCGVMPPPGFVNGIMRSYLEAPRRRKQCDGEFDECDGDLDEFDQSDEEPVSKLPTLICWTQRNALR